MEKEFDYEKIRRIILEQGPREVGSADLRSRARDEAYARKDGDVIFELREWQKFDYRKKGDVEKKVFEQINNAAEMGSHKALAWSGERYLERYQFDRAYDCFLKSGREGSKFLDVVTQESCNGASSDIKTESDQDLVSKITKNDLWLLWWKYVFKRNPTAALKYAFCIMYCNHYGSVNDVVSSDDEAIRLLEESAKEGFPNAVSRLAKIQR